MTADQMAGTEYVTDCLMAVIYKDGANDIVNTGFKRWDCKATIENPTPETEVVYLYLFFWNEKRDIYSQDQVFVIIIENNKGHPEFYFRMTFVYEGKRYKIVRPFKFKL